MELASQDAELRAALFRFVDVTPACRSLDDLARHLTGYLEEVDDRPPPIEAAMKMSGTKAGRAALGAAAAAGSPPHGAPLHRRGEPEGGAEDDPPPVGQRRGGLARPARRGDGHRRPRRTATRRAAWTRSRRSPAAAPSWPERPVLEADSIGRAPAGEPVGEGVGAHAAAAPGGAGGGPRGRRAPDAPAARAREGARRAPAHRHGVGGHGGGHARPRLRAARRAGAARRAVGGGGDPGVPEGVAAAARAGARLVGGDRARAAAGRPAGEGRVLGPRGGGRAPARLDSARVRGRSATPTATSRRSPAG